MVLASKLSSLEKEQKLIEKIEKAKKELLLLKGKVWNGRSLIMETKHAKN